MPNIFRRVTICYEYLDELWRCTKSDRIGIAPIDTILGPLIDTRC